MSCLTDFGNFNELTALPISVLTQTAKKYTENSLLT